jgi:hypothetical protein
MEMTWDLSGRAMGWLLAAWILEAVCSENEIQWCLCYLLLKLETEDTYEGGLGARRMTSVGATTWASSLVFRLAFEEGNLSMKWARKPEDWL